jgi:hypothetical protein
MYDQSFNLHSLQRELRKSDFLLHKRLKDPHYKEEQIGHALTRAAQGFQSYHPLAKSLLKKKFVFSCSRFSDRLILRKVDRNLIRVFGLKHPNRDKIISNIKILLAEGLSYRIYRLDIKAFYESISPHFVLALIESNRRLSIPTKRHVRNILEHHQSLGLPGLPRGIGLSAILAELLMRNFDNAISRLPGVYFYGRFVDDIIIITNKNEQQKEFLKKLKDSLPNELKFNYSKLTIETAANYVSPFKPPAPIPAPVVCFEFLGYKFIVREPVLSGSKKFGQFREVFLDIADSKVKKLKTRIVRSFISFNDNNDFALLQLRLRYLTSNFSVPDPDRQRYRLAGIYHNYWLVDPNHSIALPQLDHFLKKAIISSNGRVFDKFFSSSSNFQRRRLLKHSFSDGFNKKTYSYFSKTDIVNIQRCWKYA